MRVPQPRWWHRLFGAASRFFNVLLFNGDPSYPISTDAYRFKRHRLRRLIDRLFFFEPDHCRRSYRLSLVRAKALVAESKSDC